MLAPIGRREIHNTFFTDTTGEAPRGRRRSSTRVGSRESRLTGVKTRVEPKSPVESRERFAGRLRAFDPKCTVGAREVEEAEECR